MSKCATVFYSKKLKGDGIKGDNRHLHACIISSGLNILGLVSAYSFCLPRLRGPVGGGCALNMRRFGEANFWVPASAYFITHLGMYAVGLRKFGEATSI